MVLDQLNAAAAAHGLQFAPDVATSSRANLGGMIGNNSAGSRSIWHGKTVDHVIELDGHAGRRHRGRASSPSRPTQWAAAAERGDGWGRARREVERIVGRERDEILARYPRVLRRVSGYNLDEFVPECRRAHAAAADGGRGARSASASAIPARGSTWPDCLSAPRERWPR